MALAPAVWFGSRLRRPPICAIRLYEIESPSPIPLLGSLVVKNGSKSLLVLDLSIPDPVSETVSYTHLTLPTKA